MTNPLIVRLRSLVFIVWVYASMALWSILGCPLLLSSSACMFVVHGWARTVVFGARFLVGIKVEFRGLEHAPKHGAIIAGKHQSMLDTIAPFLIFPKASFVFKKELLYMPFIGWYAWRAGMIPVNRKDGAKALKSMSKACIERMKQGHQILIFPEGTRQAIDVENPDYKPGVAMLYRELSVPLHMLATNSGLFWPAHGVDRRPGLVVYECLPPLDAGLSRHAMMSQMKQEIETHSRRLMDEAR
jgi:1-acyl-sn-glycerol-3-phosphate acyltransferase